MSWISAASKRSDQSDEALMAPTTTSARRQGSLRSPSDGGYVALTFFCPGSESSFVEWLSITLSLALSLTL